MSILDQLPFIMCPNHFLHGMHLLSGQRSKLGFYVPFNSQAFIVRINTIIDIVHITESIIYYLPVWINCLFLAKTFLKY